MNNQEKLAGLIKETVKDNMPDYDERLEAQDEEIAHLKEENKDWKAQMDALQDKTFKMNTKNSGEQVYQFRGYNPEFNKNFKGTYSEDEAERMAKAFLDVAQGKAIDFASEMPQEFGSTILGLGELYSSALAHMNVQQAGAPIITLPVKATRETSDAQASATANTATSITAANIVWTIDTRIGSYAEVRVDNLEDSYFDLINGWVVPLMSEGIAQYVDAEVFNGTNSIFTTSIIDTTASVSASGTVNIAAAITLDNLNTMFYAVHWERGLGECKWFGSRAALKDIMGLTDTYGAPVMRTVPVNGKPVHFVFGSEYVITPVVANAPANGAMRLCFGDPNHYTIFLRGGEQHLVNPYILMKEDVVQFIAKLRADGNVDDHATAASSGAWTTMVRTDA